MDISDVEQNKASCGGVSAPPTLTVGDAMDASPFASEEEKREVVALLARELAGYKRRGRGSISAGIHGAEVKTEKVESAPPAAKVKSAVKPSTPKAKLLMGSAAPAAANFFAPAAPAAGRARADKGTVRGWTEEPTSRGLESGERESTRRESSTRAIVVEMCPSTH